MFRHFLNTERQGKDKERQDTPCSAVTSQDKKPVNASRNQSKNVAVYSMIQNIQAHLPPMYSPNEPTPHVNAFSNTIFSYYVSLNTDL